MNLFLRNPAANAIGPLPTDGEHKWSAYARAKLQWKLDSFADRNGLPPSAVEVGDGGLWISPSSPLSIEQVEMLARWLALETALISARQSGFAH